MLVARRVLGFQHCVFVLLKAVSPANVEPYVKIDQVASIGQAKISGIKDKMRQMNML